MLKLKTFSVFVFMVSFILIPSLYAQVVKDDFRVNDDTTGGIHITTDVEITAHGEAIVVWADGRNGEPNIYGQAYDSSSSSIGSNFKVSTYAGNYADGESEPAITSYGDSILVIWETGYGQWLLSDGSGVGSSFSLESGNVLRPDVAVNDSGFFVVWDDSVPGSGYEIFIKRFDLNGDSIGGRMVINDDGILANQYRPRIAMDKEGNFVVAWYDFRNGSYSDIYGQLFDSSGDSIGGNFLINDSIDTSNQRDLSCAMDSAGNFVVVWEDYRDGISPNIYGQRFDTAGVALDSNIRINDDVGPTDKFDPSCAIDLSGNFVVVWEDYRDGPGNIYGQLFNNAGDTVGDNFLIDEGIGSEQKYAPAVSMNENNFVVSWKDERTSTSIYVRSFENDGTPTGSEVKVNELNGTMNQTRPALDMNAAGNVVTTWHDGREPFGIYFQLLDTLGNTVGDNSWANYGYNPDVVISADSRFFITYYYMNNVCYKRFNSTGDSIGSSVIITDTAVGGQRYYPVIDVDSDKNAVIAWYDSRSGFTDIYAQMVDSAGDTIGDNFLVNDDGGPTTYQAMPAIAMSPSGRFLIVWHDFRNGEYQIYGQLYSSDGTPVDSNFRIDSATINSKTNPDIGYHPDGNFIVVWEDLRPPAGIYAQLIDTTGALVDTNFKVSDNPGYTPSVSVASTGAFVVSWSEDNSGHDIYAQRYNSDYGLDSTIFKINNETEGINPDQIEPDVATDGRNTIFTWQDPKWQRGYDIAAKVFNWYLSGTEEDRQAVNGLKILEISSPILTGKEWLTINLDLPAKVDFQLINVAGIVVSSKKLDYTTPGIKRIDFDVSKLTSGPYFLSFKTEKERTIKKTVVIR